MEENKKAPEARKAPVRKRRRPAAEPSRETAPTKLKMLVTIVGRSKADYYADVIQSFEVNMQMLVLAHGTASGEMLSRLGIASSEKTVIISLIREDMAKKALETLEGKFETIKHGKGIAFTVPLTSTIGVAIYQFLINNRKTGI